VVKWRGVGVYLVASLQFDKVNRPYVERKEDLDQTRRCRCISGSLLAYRLKIPPATTMHRTIACKHDGRLERSTLVDECDTGGSHGYMSISSILKYSDDYLSHTAPHESWDQQSASIDTNYLRKETQPVPRLCFSTLVFLNAEWQGINTELL